MLVICSYVFLIVTILTGFSASRRLHTCTLTICPNMYIALEFISLVQLLLPYVWKGDCISQQQAKLCPFTALATVLDPTTLASPR